MSDNKEWPPRLKMTPEGAAGLFLLSHVGSADKKAQDALAELLRLYYKRGYQEGKRRGGDAE